MIVIAHRGVASKGILDNAYLPLIAGTYAHLSGVPSLLTIILNSRILFTYCGGKLIKPTASALMCKATRDLWRLRDPYLVRAPRIMLKMFNMLTRALSANKECNWCTMPLQRGFIWVIYDWGDYEETVKGLPWSPKPRHDRSKDIILAGTSWRLCPGLHGQVEMGYTIVEAFPQGFKIIVHASWSYCEASTGRSFVK